MRCRHAHLEMALFQWMLISLVLVCIPTTVKAQVDAESIVGLWMFNEGTGNVAEDASFNGNTAKFSGGPKWVDGKFGRGISFDGVDDYLAVQDSDSLDALEGELTLMAWVNADAWPNSWNHVIRKTPENPRIYIMGVHDTALPFTFLKTDAQQYADIQGPHPVPTREWVHLAMTYDGQELAIWVNGEQEVVSPAQGQIEASDGELRIGRGDPAGYFTGTMDEVALLRVALTSIEIQSIMDAGWEQTLAVSPKDQLITTWSRIKAKYSR